MAGFYVNVSEVGGRNSALLELVEQLRRIVAAPKPVVTPAVARRCT
jgi:hypothetical protein